MFKLEDIKPGIQVFGLEPNIFATVADVVPIGDNSVHVFYRTPDCVTKERLIVRADEANLSAEISWVLHGTAQSKREATSMEMRTYTVTDSCSVDLIITERGLMVCQIMPHSKHDMHAILCSPNEGMEGDGLYACWDATAKFDDQGGLLLSGKDGPNGGTGCVVRIKIPFCFVDEIRIFKA
jgi:hypothetical protein